ncbi:MAG: UDP-hydrolyzing UDP-N-acetyl-D-glucosamine 2-epimerase [Parasphingorhabdus sp.]|jgi:UDP-hydrolysing UDP-N-acetyl-D-glucosamine 2-epimerase
MRKICIVIGSRANYSSIKSAMHEIQNHPELKLQVVVTASAVLDRYGAVSDLISADGFELDASIFSLIEGETPATMAKSTALGLMELPTVFERLKPDIILTVGDRFETMATTLAAVYMNIRLAHTMGGEITGTIDESIRHAITKFAHIHFPACSDASDRIVKLGELPEFVYNVGCPRMDLVAEILGGEETNLEASLFSDGVGRSFDLTQPFLLLSQHPVTTEYGDGERQINASLAAIDKLGLPAIALWPNPDAGSEEIARGMRKYREHNKNSKIHFFKNLPIKTYVQLMANTACLIGNSSSGIREGAFIGTPAVNVGSRQNNRQRGPNVLDTDCDKDAIVRAVQTHISHGRYDSAPIYGDGHAGKRIANILAETNPSIQKTIAY